jgi:hypothetical protein
MQHPLLSVVIPCYHRFWNFIQAVEHNMIFTNPDIELVLVLDEPSEENAFVQFARFNVDRMRIRVLVNDTDHDWRPPCIPLNVGIRRSLGRYCIVQSPETVAMYPTTNHCRDLIADAERAKARRFWCGRFLPRDPIQILAGNFLEHHYKASLGPTSQVTSGFVLFKKQDAIDIGGYDERRTRYGPDDCDLKLRLQRHGVKQVIDPYIRAVHINHPAPAHDQKDWEIVTKETVLTNADQMGLAPFRCAYDWCDHN